MKPRLSLESLTADTIAGVSIALVLIPQSLAYADLAGLPPHYGLYASILPCIAAALLASSRFLQTGPTAVTSLLTFGALTPLAAAGTAEFVALAALLALLVGVIRIGLGLVKAGSLTFLLSPPVLLGFTVGAAVLIAASQVPTVLGVSAEGGSVLGRAGAAAVAVSDWRWESIGVAAATIAVVLLGQRIHKLFPGVLIAALGGLAYATWGGYGGEVLGAIPAGLPELTADFPWTELPVLIVPALVIAVIGFAEPTAIARTYATLDRTPWDADREFVSQGLANVAAAFSGAFPVGGSFSRSALSRLAGTRTRFSGVVTGVVIGAFVPFAWILEALPRPVLGAIILVAVIGLLKRFAEMWRLWKRSRPQTLIALLTFGATLAMAPHVERAVLVGLGVALAVHAWREMKVGVVTTFEGTTLHIGLHGVLWFASSQPVEGQLLDGLAAHPNAERVAFDLRGLGRIDYTGAVALATAVERAEAAGLKVHLAGFQPQCRRILEAVCPRLLAAAAA